MMVLLLDNYDPSTMKLAEYLREFGATVEIYRNDEIEVDEIRERAPERIVVSSGADTPAEAGISLPVIRELGVDTPILGIGLGHLAIAVAFGARVVPVSGLRDAAPVSIKHNGIGVLRDIASPIAAATDQELMVDPRSVPSSLDVSARTADGVILGLRHRTLVIDGVGFHLDQPIAAQILRNFLEAAPSFT